jgi:4-hydroxyacetophenone monooxygenase
MRFRDAVADETALQAALAEADIAPTLLVLVHLGGDTAILDEVAPYITGAWSFMEEVPETLKQKVRDRLVDVLKDYAATGRAVPQTRPDALLQRMMSAGVGQPVPDEYVPLLVEEMRLGSQETRDVGWRRDPSQTARADFKVVVIGAGFAGLCAAIKLKQAGIPFVVLEKNDQVGGTWYENDYPGCGVDTPNHFFSYSFHPSNDWSHHFSKRDEIQGYIEKVADDFGLRPHIRFGTEVTAADYDEEACRWRVSCRSAGGGETLVAQAVITAVGQLNRPAAPAIPGLETFEGPCFHTARWDKSVDLAGKRVAMIGTGASGMQAGPSIAPEVGKLTIFQRTPHWSMANPNYHKAVTEGQKWALRNIPLFSEWCRFQLFWASSDGFHASLQVDPAWQQPALSLNAANHRMRETIVAHIRRELDGDEDLIAKCVPDYPPYGKRMLRDNHWFRMLRRDNVELVAAAIDRIEGNRIVMRDGSAHDVDVIVLATGFQASKILWPMQITGRDGVSIRALWGDDDPRAYKGMLVPGFPNLFVTFGPNTNLAHGGSAIFHFECQIHYIMQALRELIETGQDALEIRRDVHDAYNALVDEKCRNMVWAHPGVRNWYKNKHNRVTLTSPWRLVDYWALTKTFEPSEVVFTRPRAETAAFAERERLREAG